MFERLPVLFRSAMYALRGGFTLDECIQQFMSDEDAAAA